jgi:hypothetical protein
MQGNGSDQSTRRAQDPPHHLPFLSPRDPVDCDDTTSLLPPIYVELPGCRDPEDSGSGGDAPPPGYDPPPPPRGGD